MINQIAVFLAFLLVILVFSYFRKESYVQFSKRFLESYLIMVLVSPFLGGEFKEAYSLNTITMWIVVIYMSLSAILLLVSTILGKFRMSVSGVEEGQKIPLKIQLKFMYDSVMTAIPVQIVLTFTDAIGVSVVDDGKLIIYREKKDDV